MHRNHYNEAIERAAAGWHVDDDTPKPPYPWPMRSPMERRAMAANSKTTDATQ